MLRSSHSWKALRVIQVKKSTKVTGRSVCWMSIASCAGTMIPWHSAPNLSKQKFRNNKLEEWQENGDNGMLMNCRVLHDHVTVWIQRCWTTCDNMWFSLRLAMVYKHAWVKVPWRALAERLWPTGSGLAARVSREAEIRTWTTIRQNADVTNAKHKNC